MKYSYLLLAASIGLLAGCSQMEQDFADVNSLTDGALVEKVIFDVLPIKDGDDPETRASAVPNGGAVSFAWEVTDTVGIFPDKGSQAFFSMESGAGTSSASFDGGGWALKQGTSYISYYPLVGEFYLDRTKIPVSFVGQKQIGTSSPFHGARYYLATEPTSSENGVMRFSYKTLNTIINVNATLPAGTYTKMSLTIEEPLFIEEGTYSLDERTIVGTKFTNTLKIDLENVTLTQEGVLPIYIMSAPVNLKDKQVTVMIISSDGKEFKCDKTPSKAYEAGTRFGLTCDKMEQSDSGIEMETGFEWNVVSHSVVEPLRRYNSRRWFVADGVLYCDSGGKILTVDNQSHTITTYTNSSYWYQDIYNIDIWTSPDGNVYSCFSNTESWEDDYYGLYRFENGNWTEIKDYGHFTYGHPEGNSIWKTNNYVYTSEGSAYYRASDGCTFGEVTMSNMPTYFSASNVWTSASGTAYYSDGTSHYRFNESGLSWTQLSASGWPSITAEDVFIAGSITYWVSGGDCYMFNESSRTWTRIENDFRAGLYGRYIWSYGGKYYYSDGTINKELKQGGQSFTTITMLSFSFNSSSNPPICNVNGNMIWSNYLKTPGTCVWNRLSIGHYPIVTLSVSMGGQYYGMNEIYDDEEYTYDYYLYPIDPTSGLQSFDYQYFGDGLTYYYAQSLWKDRNNFVHYSTDKRVFNDASGRCYYCCDSNGSSNGNATHYRIYDETEGWSAPIPLNSPMTYTGARYFWSDGEGNIYYTSGYTQYQLVPKN